MFSVEKVVLKEPVSKRELIQYATHDMGLIKVKCVYYVMYSTAHLSILNAWQSRYVSMCQRPKGRGISFKCTTPSYPSSFSLIFPQMLHQQF